MIYQDPSLAGTPSQTLWRRLVRFGVCFIAQVRTDLQPSVERGQVQGRLLPAVSHGGVGQLVEQHRNHVRVAILGCTVKRRLLLMVLGKNQRRE